MMGKLLTKNSIIKIGKKTYPKPEMEIVGNLCVSHLNLYEKLDAADERIAGLEYALNELLNPKWSFKEIMAGREKRVGLIVKEGDVSKARTLLKDSQ